jgi:arylsulfatase A-like enzyme
MPVVLIAASPLGLCAAAEATSGMPIILISIDTLRADHLSAYGYHRIRTPNIDSFADDGTLFSDVECQVPLTLPSHTSLLTSTYPFENRVEENGQRVPAGAVTLASVLHSHGYKTAAFIGSVFLEREMGLDQGFDFYDSPFHFAAFSSLSGELFFAGPPRNRYSVRSRRDGALVVRAAARWLSENRGQPPFAFVHLFDLHLPYKEPSPDAVKRGVSGYDGQLGSVDQTIGWFKQWLQQNGWWDRSLVIVLSDHGESLGDHGETTHGYFIYQSTLWVPLLVHWPVGAPGAAARINRPAGLIDVGPTILDFLHIQPPPSFEGESLLRDNPSRSVLAESVYAHDGFGWAPLHSIRVGTYKYIEAPQPELYNLEADPHEQTNLVRKDPKQAQELRGQLLKLLARYAPKRPAAPGHASPQTDALLNSLGYIASGPRAQNGAAAADPKARLPEYWLYEKAEDYAAEGRTDAVEATLLKILHTDPHNTLARRDLGALYLDQKQYAKARAAFELVLAVAPDDYMSQYELGIADERDGLLKDALRHLQAACAIAPESEQCRSELAALEQKMK